jgi:hypothetical protein
VATFLVLQTQQAPELSPEERTEVKRVTSDPLGRFKALLKIDWRRRSAARAQLPLAIEDVLDTGLPQVNSPDLY